MKQSLLFLDDDPSRHESFKAHWQNTSNIEIDYFYTYEEAVLAFSNKSYDIACLDHDLCIDDRYCDPTGETFEKTGSDLAKYIVNELPRHKWPKIVIIHSYNPAGAKYMVDTFNSVGIQSVWRPFNVARYVL